MRPGDRVLVRVWESGCRCDPPEHEAVVHLLASDGRVAAVGGYDGIIDGFVGWLPVLWTGEQAATLLGTPIELVPL